MVDWQDWNEAAFERARESAQGSRDAAIRAEFGLARVFLAGAQRNRAAENAVDGAIWVVETVVIAVHPVARRPIHVRIGRRGQRCRLVAFLINRAITRRAIGNRNDWRSASSPVLAGIEALAA